MAPLAQATRLKTLSNSSASLGRHESVHEGACHSGAINLPEKRVPWASKPLATKASGCALRHSASQTTAGSCREHRLSRHKRPAPRVWNGAGTIPTRTALAKTLGAWGLFMKTLGWAAIVYSVHDAYTLTALLLLIAGEIALSLLAEKPRPRRS